MKAVIIGGGIGGLATYHALRKHLPSSATIDIYEAYPSTLSSQSSIGSGIVLGPNGQRAIASILPSAVPYIHEHGFESSTLTFRNDSGRTLAEVPFGSKERYGHSQTVISRTAVHESLLLDGDTNAKVRWNMRVKRVWETEEAAHIEFEDGTLDSCDLLVGADGAGSKCREALFGKEYALAYDGLTGLNGIIPLSSLPTTFHKKLKENRSMFLTTSRTGFFGASFCTPATSPDPSLLWFTSIEINPPASRDTPHSDLVPMLLDRFGDWSSPYDTSEGRFFREVILRSSSATDSQSWLTLPRYFTPTLPHWTSLHGLSESGSAEGANGQGRIVLLGDAAHCMSPDATQGVSQAAEDALTLALLLKYYISTSTTDSDAISQAAKAYEDIRMPRVNKILAKSTRRPKRREEMSFLQQIIREIALWVRSWIPEWYMYNETYAYNVENHVSKYLGVPAEQL